MIGINGAAARLAHVGDLIIVINYGLMDNNEMQNHKPKIVILDGNNKIEKII
ncbi:MAG: aspartate 1-decarboxylase [Candidatus Cloacimonadaceae bacterium]